MNTDPRLAILDTLDHATFDATLIEVWRPDYEWTRSEIKGNIPFTPADYALSTRNSLARTLPAFPGMEGQKFNGERDVLTYVAFETLYNSMKHLHLRPYLSERLPEAIRNDFRDCLQKERLLTVHQYSPLWGKGTRIDAGNDNSAFELPLQSRWDKKLLESLSASRAVMERFLHEHTPRLAALDRGLTKVYAEDFRQQMFTLLEPHAYFFPKLQESMRELAINTWLREAGDVKEKVCTAAKNFDLLDDDKSEDHQAFIDSLNGLLNDQQTEKSLLHSQIRERMPGLEFLALRAAEDGNQETLIALQPLFDRIKKELKLIWGEYPALAFVQFTIAGYCTHLPSGKLLMPKDLLANL